MPADVYAVARMQIGPRDAAHVVRALVNNRLDIRALQQFQRRGQAGGATADDDRRLFVSHLVFQSSRCLCGEQDQFADDEVKGE